MEEGQLDALDAALSAEDWAAAVELLGATFAVAAPGTTLEELRNAVKIEPAYAAWADPRVDAGWPTLGALEQWNKLSTFLHETIDRLGFAVTQALEIPQVELGMAMSCMREGFPPRGALSKDILYDAFSDYLIKTLLCSFGTLELMSNGDGRGFCILAEILDGGAGAIVHALTIKSFLRTVTIEAIERMQAAGKI